jgi:tetratricopeptide (TPR) repeat protein
LENAVKDSPGSIIARYLLGRAYRRNGDYPKALDVLEPVIKNHHEEFRSFVEYALVLVYSQRPYSEAIAILKLSTLYGLSDPRFIATLAGMFFMNDQFPDSELIFAESFKHNFRGPELNTIQFQPPDPSNPKNPLRIKGKVVVVKAGYAIIESVGLPRFLCPGSKFTGLIMTEGLAITFEPAFTARNRIVEKPLTV